MVPCGDFTPRPLQLCFHHQPWSNISRHPPETLEVHITKSLDKVLRSTELARQNGQKNFWVDNCCIDKTSSSELSEAINSMYRRYAGADMCYAYLSDVPSTITEDPFEFDSKFRQSRRFRRGWTLQELVASRHSTPAIGAISGPRQETWHLPGFCMRLLGSNLMYCWEKQVPKI